MLAHRRTHPHTLPRERKQPYTVSVRERQTCDRYRGTLHEVEKPRRESLHMHTVPPPQPIDARIVLRQQSR